MKWVTRFFLSVAITGFIVSTSRADLANPISGIVQQLAHPRFQEREKAQKRLLDVGEPALPALRAALNSSDEELKSRAERIISQIELRMRSEAMLLAPKIRLKFVDQPLSQVVAEVNKQTQLNYSLDHDASIDPKKKITFDTGLVPFWEAIEQFHAATGLDEKLKAPVETNIPRQMMLEEDNPYDLRIKPIVLPSFQLTAAKLLPADSKRAIRVKAAPPTTNGNKINPKSGDVTVMLQIDPTPGLLVQEIVGIDIKSGREKDGRQIEISRMTTLIPPLESDRGVMLKAQPVQMMEMPNSGNLQSKNLVPAIFKSNGLKINELEELRGELAVNVIAPKATLFTIDQIRQAKDKKVTLPEGIQFRINSTTVRLNRTAVVRMSIDMSPLAVQHAHFEIPYIGNGGVFRKVDPADQRIEAPQLPDFYLTTANGEKIKARSFGAKEMRENVDDTMHYDVEILFDKPSTWEGVSLTMQARRVVTVTMPFTLKNVPMPAK